jgi:hypothetical protein
MKIEFKTWPKYFAAVLDGTKPFEWRSDDQVRRFDVGDVLCLREWDPEAKKYTGRECVRVVTYVLREAFGIPVGFVVMGLGLPLTLEEFEAKWSDIRCHHLATCPRDGGFDFDECTCGHDELWKQRGLDLRRVV